MITAFIIFWVVCGILAYGADYAYYEFKGSYRYLDRYVDCIEISASIAFHIFFGAIGLLLAYFYTKHFKHGFKFK